MDVVMWRVRHGPWSEYGFVYFQMGSGMCDSVENGTRGIAAIRVRGHLVEGQRKRWNWLVVCFLCE